jgi:aldehyde:ferredoxin oxidoreductase
MEKYPDFIYDRPTMGSDMTMYIDGKWKYDTGKGRKLDRAKVEDFKTRFYKFEGYNPENGYPTRATLEKMNLKKVADALQSKGRLG